MPGVAQRGHEIEDVNVHYAALLSCIVGTNNEHLGYIQKKVLLYGMH